MEIPLLLLIGGAVSWAVLGLGRKPRVTRSTTPKPASNPRNATPTATSNTRRVARNAVKETAHGSPPPVPSSLQIKGRAWVIDGDTIVVNRVKIRLAGIDAPELDQPWGQKSKWEMIKLCKGQTISVELSGQTSYDRLVGTCFLPDGRDLGAEIIKAGLALDGGHFSAGKYRHLEDPAMRRKLRGYGRWR